ncbi:MAG: hypothetical protein NC212_05505 [Staphylococcus sp.]|nr:hypothetical protein [Staphylococcus sp.]
MDKAYRITASERRYIRVVYVSLPQLASPRLWDMRAGWPPGLAWGFRMIYLPPADMSSQSRVMSHESRVMTH